MISEGRGGKREMYWTPVSILTMFSWLWQRYVLKLCGIDYIAHWYTYMYVLTNILTNILNNILNNILIYNN